MNIFRVIGIFSNSIYPESTKKITGVLLSNGTKEPISQVILGLNGSCQYYYIDSDFNKIFLETVQQINAKPYIRSTNCGKLDALLTLPVFYDVLLN